MKRSELTKLIENITKKILNENDLINYEKKVANIILKKFHPNEIKMAGLTIDSIIDDLTSKKNYHNEYIPKFKLLKTTIDAEYENDTTPENAAKFLYNDYAKLIHGQLRAM